MTIRPQSLLQNVSQTQQKPQVELITLYTDLLASSWGFTPGAPYLVEEAARGASILTFCSKVRIHPIHGQWD